MLKKKDAETVVEILLKDDLTLEEYKILLQKNFPEDQIYHIFTLLSILLQNCVLEQNQQIIAFYYLLTSFDCDFDENPFFSLFLYIYENRFEYANDLSPILVSIIGALLSQEQIPGIGNYTINQLSTLKFSKKPMTLHIKSDVRPSFLHVDLNSPQTDKNHQNQIKIENLQSQEDSVILSYKDLLITFLSEVPLSRTYTPSFLSYTPEPILYSMEECEIGYIDSPFLKDCFLYDSPKFNAVHLFKKAQEAVLEDSKVKELLTTLNTNPEICRKIDNNQLFFMISNNIEIAKKYIEIWSKKHTQIFDVLSTLPMSINSFEIIKFSYKLPGVSVKFIDKWILNGLNDISSIGNEQELMQKASMFCRFTSFLIQNNAQIGQTIKVELKSFCLKMSLKGVAEAKELFQHF